MQSLQTIDGLFAISVTQELLFAPLSEFVDAYGKLTRLCFHASFSVKLRAPAARPRLIKRALLSSKKLVSGKQEDFPSRVGS